MSSILVLADRRADRELLTTVLRYANHNVHPVASGDEALRVAHDERPDLIFTDTVMPSKNGVAFVRRLRDDPEIGATAVVFCSAGPLGDRVTRIAAAGGTAYLVAKSSDPRTIIRTVNQILGVPPPPAGPVGAGEFDREQLRVLNERLVQKIDALEAANDQRRQLVGHLIAVHEEEKRKIADEIHDDSIQAVLAIGMRLDVLIQQGGESRPQLERLRGMAAEAVVGLRRLLIDLQPVDLGGRGLASALAVHLEQARDEDGVAYHLENALEHQVTEPARTVLYRAAREALANARTHAGASRIDVVLQERDGGFAVMVRDDGKGFAAEHALRARPGHLGLPALLERVEMAGGSLRLDSRPGGGSTVEVWVPQPDAA